MQVSDKQISVVIQGPPRFTRDGINLTKLAIESVRRLLPESEIILSSWKGANLDTLEPDRVILSDDPGSLPRPKTRDSNVNRQICSTVKGIISATRPYCIKLRSDCILQHTGFLDSIEARTTIIGPKIFRQPVISSSVYFKNPQRAPFLFHPGDLFHFGLTEDLIRLWDIPHAQREHISNWQDHYRRPLISFTGRSFFRYLEEQYIWITCLKKHGYTVDINFPWEINHELIELSERSILQNFQILDNDAIGLWIPWNTLFFGINKIYSKDEIDFLSGIYCQNDLAQIRKRIRRVLWNQRIRTPLQFFANQLNKLGVF